MIKFKEFLIIFKNLILSAFLLLFFGLSVFYGVKYHKLKQQYEDYTYRTDKQIEELTGKYRHCRNENKFLNQELSKTMISLSEQNAIIEEQLNQCRKQVKDNDQLDKQLRSIYVNLRRLTNSVYSLHKTLEERSKSEQD